MHKISLSHSSPHMSVNATIYKDHELTGADIGENFVMIDGPGGYSLITFSQLEIVYNECFKKEHNSIITGHQAINTAQ